VDRKSVEGFARVWNHNGVTLILNDAHIDFARDFANVTLRNFVSQVAQQQMAAAQAAAPKIVEGK